MTDRFSPTEDRFMTRLMFAAIVLWSAAPFCRAADFEDPVRLKVRDTAIRVESPGYAAPGWGDLKGDGSMYLLVGQFRDGKIRAFKHLNADKFAIGEWIYAEGEVAEVPGVW
jgi:hypothetical protein